MKKHLLFLLALAFFTPSTFALDNHPSDLVPSDPYYSDIIGLYDKGVVSGNDDGTFGGDNTITRAAFTKIVIGAKFPKEEIAACGDPSFPDGKGDWYSNYLCMAEKHGIVDGYANGTYQPGNDVLVSEAGKIIVNAFNYPTNEDPLWYKPYLLVLEEKFALPITLTGPAHKLKRGEMASMMNRLLDEDTGQPSTTFENLEQGIMVGDSLSETIKENMKEGLLKEGNGETTTEETLDLSQIYECENVKTVNFIVDGTNNVHYGSFAWAGKVISATENGETHLRLMVENDESIAFNFYKDQALAMNNEGPNRYENERLDFALGSLFEGSLVSAAEMTEELKSTLLEKQDSEEEITLTFAVKFTEGGGMGLLGVSNACSIQMAE